MFSRVYAQKNGDLAQLAQIFIFSFASMEETEPFEPLVPLDGPVARQESSPLLHSGA